MRSSLDPADFSPQGSSLLRWGFFALLLFGFILIPFALFEGKMNAVVQQSLQSGASVSFVSLAVIAFLTADIALPIPSSFVLSTTGYLLGAAAGTGVCFVGMTVASLAGYWLGQHAGASLAQRLIGQRGLQQFRLFAQRYGDAVLVAFRAVPVLAEATLLMAGLSGMRLRRFLALVSLGNVVVSALYAWIGAVSASRSSFIIATAASIVLPTVIVLATRHAVPTECALQGEPLSNSKDTNSDAKTPPTTDHP